MNQITNKIPFGLLSEEQQAQFSGEAKRRGLYEMWADDWVLSKRDSAWSKSSVYRLVIKDDEWYYIKHLAVEVIQGNKINFSKDSSITTLRPATPKEIEAAKPKELTLEEKVKAKYPDYEVVMLKWDEIPVGVHRLFLPYKKCFFGHTEAQSMKGFYKYVYLVDVGLSTFSRPTMQWAKDETLQPIAVLFERDK